jgi:prepilin-type N-terminal cleavage/methylation domain-containing protein
MLKRSRLWRRTTRSGQKGLSLIEVVISMLVAGILVAGFLTAIANSTRTLVTVDEKETAKNLAESQMELVKQSTFGTGYSGVVDETIYPNYSVRITSGDITDRDDDIQKITVFVDHRGREILSLVGYKVK